jgi:hypothetical protein
MNDENPEKEIDRSAEEKAFRVELKEIFLQANPFATEEDFERIYPVLRDKIMIKNTFKARERHF